MVAAIKRVDLWEWLLVDMVMYSYCSTTTLVYPFWLFIPDFVHKTW